MRKRVAGSAWERLIGLRSPGPGLSALRANSRPFDFAQDDRAWGRGFVCAETSRERSLMDILELGGGGGLQLLGEVGLAAGVFGAAHLAVGLAEQAVGHEVA